MTSPVAPGSGITAAPPGPELAVFASVPMTTLAKRADFLRAAAARRQGSPSFLLQARPRGEAADAGGGIRVGYTCSKKVGNAVARNRAKRRLREAARLVLAVHGTPGWDYVLVGRPQATASRPIDALLADLARALHQIHAKP